MSVVKRGNSKYWYIEFQFDGEKFIKSSRTTSKRAAEQMEVDWRARLHAQRFLGIKPSITMKEALDLYCSKRHGSSFHAGICSLAKICLQYFNAAKRLDDFTSPDLEHFKRFRVQSGVGPQTIKHSLNVIRGAMREAHAMGYSVAEVKFPSVSIPRPALRYLSAEEEARLLVELDPHRHADGLPPVSRRSARLKKELQDAYDLVVILLDTGARYSEIANIERRRLDLNSREIRLWRSKVQNESILYMTDRVVKVISRRLQEKDSQYLFTNKAGGPRGYATQAIRKAIKRAGLIGCKIHTLRHTHASRLIQHGLSVYEVREVLGHSDIKTTMRYAHLESRHVTAKARDVINALNYTPTT